jgi:hypothetical protein
MKRLPIALSCLLVALFASSSIAVNAAVNAPVQYSVTHAPTPPKGANDEYRCTWFDPKFTTAQVVTKSEFAAAAGTSATARKELHHAIAYIANPSVVDQVKALDPSGKKGWSCFSSPLGASSMATLGALPWLYGWSPGHGADTSPDGYGIRVPAGSLIVLQIHYNSLAGKKSLTAQFRTWSEPQSTSSRVPLTMKQYVAAPTLPCVAPFDSVTKYPLCSHSNSLNDLAKRFGASAKEFALNIESSCNHGVLPTSSASPNATTATCTWPVGGAPFTVHAVWPHMHLLGKTFSITVCRQDATCSGDTTSLALVPNYNFDNQISYEPSPAVTANPGDYIKVTCSYDPTLRKLNPQTKNLPPRYVTWGDGSSDEMCLGTLIVSAGANS